MPHGSVDLHRIDAARAQRAVAVVDHRAPVAAELLAGSSVTAAARAAIV